MNRALATYTKNRNDPDQLIQKYAQLIERIARRLVSRIGIPSLYDDLWSAGAIGLLEAAPRFSAEKGANFETFVGHRIRGAMLDELRELDHLPRRLRTRTDEVQKARQKLATQLGREPEPDELAAELKVDVEEVEAISILSEPPVALDSVMPLLSGESTVDDDIDRARTVKLLAAAIEELPERLSVLVSLHYVEGMSYREIAQIFDVSEPRVCQLHGEAMAKIRAIVARDGGMDLPGPAGRKPGRS